MNIDQVLGGATPKWGLTIRDEAGLIIDPSDIDKVDKVHIEIYNEESKEILAKYAYPAEDGSIGSVTFTGSGLNDMTNGGTYTGVLDRNYRIQIDEIGATDTFRWSDDGGLTWKETGVEITGSPQNLNCGVTIEFGATTGHTLNDRWDFITIGWATAIVENNEQVTFVIDSAKTSGATKGVEYGVLVEAHLKVTDGLGYPDNIDIVIKRGTLVLFKDPKE